MSCVHDGIKPGCVSCYVSKTPWIQDVIAVKPEFFADLDFGLECGPGWAELIKRAALEAPDGVRASQIKEKLGGLRIYWWSADDTAGDEYIKYWDLIASIENESYETCETCGKPGKLGRVGDSTWLTTTCGEHHDR